MTRAPRTFQHPSFGKCELVPTVVAIKWVAPLGGDAVGPALSELSLHIAKEPSSKERRAAEESRDPRPSNVNQSAHLTWASGRKLDEKALSRIDADRRVEWVAPVYQATASEQGPQSYFAINPTVLLLTQDLAAAIGDPRTLDDSSTVDEVRTRLMKGWVVLSLPNGNAFEVAEKVRAAAVGAPNSVKFENIPYISPTCTGCCSGVGHTANADANRCAPSTTPVFPNDTFFANQWGLQRINAPSAWPLTEGDPNVVIAVLDQGVELGHPDLNMWPISYSTITHTNDGSPVGPHGTCCAGIIGARIDNGAGVSGLAGQCRVMAIATNFADTQVAEGLYYAADNGARVVSMSFGVYPSWMVWDFAIIEAALQYCQDKNVVLVAASGNENQPVSRFPGTDPRTICVGGSNREDIRKAVGDASIESWWGACYGTDVDVVAPCLEIPTTDQLGPAGYTPTDYDMRFNGTSAATPHVAALAGLLLSLDPTLSNVDVRRTISETTDKINAAGYTYLPTSGKPYGTWNNEVGYGRINVERALLLACPSACKSGGPCTVELPRPDPCCVSPCDPPWRPDEQCITWYEEKYFRVPLGRKPAPVDIAAALAAREYIEFRITYEHRLCLLGKQHGPLLYTVTLLPGEKVTLFQSDRYRRITSEQERYSVQTSFMQFLSVVHQARVTNTLDVLDEKLTSASTGSAGSKGGGFFFGLFGFGGGSSTSKQTNVTDHNVLAIRFASDQFAQSVFQASQLTQAERSVVVSTYEDKESIDVTSRTLHNANDCRAVTYFVRKVVELYAVSTRVSEISYRIIAPNVPSDWHAVNDLGWLPPQVQDQIKNLLQLLPRVGDTVEQPKPISLATDGVVYDPELAHCCSCEPQREAAVAIQLEKQKAEALKACLEAQTLEVELQRRRMLLQKGELAPFEAASAAPAPVPSD